MDQFLGRTRIPNGKVGAYRAKLEAEGYRESERGNGVTIYENGEGGCVTFEQVSPRRVEVTCWRTIADGTTPAPSPNVCGHGGCTLRPGHIPGHTDR